MTGLLLDTCVISEMAKPAPDVRVDRWLAAHHAQARFSVVVLGEIACGIALLPEGPRRRQLDAWLANFETRFADRILPIDAPVARAWAGLHAIRQQAGRPLALADGLIAATAQVHGLVVATRNRVDFDGTPGVQVVDPWAG
jgi:predicted nucleic acid-binding protein